MQKHIKDFVVPRERTSPEIARAFQSILLSLQNLERAVGQEVDPTELAAMRAEIERLKQETRRPPIGLQKPSGITRGTAEEIADEAVENAPRATLTGTIERDNDMVGAVRERLYYYDVGNPPPERFVALYYLSKLDVVNENPLTEAQIPNYVADAMFNPATPNQEPGTHATIFTFRHIAEGTLIVAFGLE